MKPLIVSLLIIMSWPALAQPGPWRQRGDSGRSSQREYQRQMPPPGRRMSGEERERLREQVRSGDMSRDEARERGREQREQREQRELDPARHEQRERLRRDVQEANRDLRRQEGNRDFRRQEGNRDFRRR